MEQVIQKRILKPEEVWAKVGLRKTAIKERVKKGLFPPPIVLGANRRGWLESAVDAWIDQQPSAPNCAEK